MRFFLFSCALCFSAMAQPFGAGLKVGAPLTDAVSLVSSGAPDQTVSTNRYVIGPYGEVRLPGGFSVEVDALYRSFSYFQGAPNGNGASGSNGSWEFPVMAKEKLLPIIEDYRQLGDFREIIPISAKKGDGLEILLDTLSGSLPSGSAFFPEDQLTDQPERFLAAEIIREQLLLSTEEEVPYASAVVIERFAEEGKLTRIAAVIYCEREGQKAIIIGKGGQMLKKIGSAARPLIERMLGKKVYLELFVKVEPGWREQRDFIAGLDWRRQLEESAQRHMGDEE